MLKNFKRLSFVAACITCAAASAETPRCVPWTQAASGGPAQIRLQQGNVVFSFEGAAASDREVRSSGPTSAIVTLASTDSPTANSAADTPILRASNAKPAPASPLITDPKLRVTLSSVEWAGYRMTMLVSEDIVLGPRLLGLVSSRQGAPSGESSYHWFPASAKSSQQHRLDLAGLEHLLRLAVSHDATQTFRFSVARQGRTDGRPAAGARLTHGQLLAQLAEARQCVARATAANGAAPVKPWRTVSVSSALDKADKMLVSARVRDGKKPIVGALVSFSRAPHFDCSAPTDQTGLAACRLEDMHGHAEDAHGSSGHDDHGAAPTVATFPGHIHPETIVLPMTAVR